MSSLVFNPFIATFKKEFYWWRKCQCLKRRLCERSCVYDVINRIINPVILNKKELTWDLSCSVRLELEKGKEWLLSLINQSKNKLFKIISIMQHSATHHGSFCESNRFYQTSEIKQRIIWFDSNKVFHFRLFFFSCNCTVANTR